ncbi:MAG: hypothetical protein IJ470_00570, partial [Clostridia bacterium]|nr:hypothetical protein [Clostridia bacterium]
MKNSKTNLIKRIIPLMLAVMLVASAMFVPNVVSAATEEEYTALGMHAPTVLNFDDGIPTYTTAGDGLTVAAEDGGMLVTNIATSNRDRVLFETYSDIETLSMDIKMASAVNNNYSPAIVFYDETYTADDGTSVNAFSRLDIGYTNNAWNARFGGSNMTYTGQSALNDVLPEGFDFTKNYLTLTVTYGTYSVGTTVCKQKMLKSIAFSYDGEELINYDAEGGWWRQYTYYGVDKTKKTDATDNEKVYIGFAGQGSLNMYVDNIKVTYRNTEKVISYIDAIGDVALNDTCKAAIEKAEAAYALLEAEQKSAVTNYATLTAARASYNELAQNADVAEVIDKIAAIGTVNASAECLAKIEAAEKAYAALTADKQAKVTNYKTLVNARADYNTAKYGIHMAETIDLTDSVSTTVEGTTANSLTVNAESDNAYYNVYGDINTVTFDMYVHSTVTEGAVNLLNFQYYEFDGKTDIASNILDRSLLNLSGSKGEGKLAINQGIGHPYYSKAITDYSTLLGKWVTVEHTYSSEYETTRSDRHRKYIERITIKDGDTTVVDWDITEGGSYYEWLMGYGVDILNNPDAKDPETVKIGF